MNGNSGWLGQGGQGDVTLAVLGSMGGFVSSMKD